jgi:hypothetical protein
MVDGHIWTLEFGFFAGKEMGFSEDNYAGGTSFELDWNPVKSIETTQPVDQFHTIL